MSSERDGRDAGEWNDGAVVDAIAADLKADAVGRRNAGRVAAFRKKHGDDPTGRGVNSMMAPAERRLRIQLLERARRGERQAIDELRRRYNLTIIPSPDGAPRRSSAPPA